MTYSFIAYIDESGDDGLTNRYRTPGIRGGSSHWLNIGAVVWRYSRDLDAVKWAQEIMSQLPNQRKNKPLHFADLNHGQRVMAVSSLSNKPMLVSAVMANKPIIPQGVYTEKNQLYFYTARYLLERISWLCRDLRPKVPEGNGKVKIIFSRRGGMSYDDFRSYMRNLMHRKDGDIKIWWPVIDMDGIEAQDHGKKYGLQLADISISGLTAALEPDFYGNSEIRYTRLLKPIVYHRKHNYLSYGIKIIPDCDRIPLNPQQEEFITLFGGTRQSPGP